MKDMNDSPTIALAMAALKHLEQCRLRAYWDVTGWAIGYGQHSPGVSSMTTWTQEQCDQALLEDVTHLYAELLSIVHVELRSYQMAALISFVYNVGLGAFRGSSLLRLLNEGELATVPAQMTRWVYASGPDGETVLPSLVARREFEISVWNDDYDVTKLMGGQ